MMNEVIDNIQGLMPKVLDESLPDMVQPSMDLPEGFGS